jgi:creatinine amidohydrolase/Fe(II)-dependent formamide hydrolase-like protein
VLGDPAGASADEGALLIDALVAKMTASYDRCLVDVHRQRPVN